MIKRRRWKSSGSHYMPMESVPPKMKKQILTIKLTALAQRQSFLKKDFGSRVLDIVLEPDVSKATEQYHHLLWDSLRCSDRRRMRSYKEALKKLSLLLEIQSDGPAEPASEQHVHVVNDNVYRHYCSEKEGEIK